MKKHEKQSENNELDEQEEIAQETDQETAQETEINEEETTQNVEEEPIPPPQDECACGCGEPNYLNDLLRVQAEFDNYRKRMQTALGDARQDGFMDAITQFLPALDSFKMATDMITDKNTLMGIKFIEKGILDTLSKMGVDVIDATGKFDPNFHQAIDTDSTADVESGYIVKEAYKGFTYKGKVIRYSQVIVKK